MATSPKRFASVGPYVHFKEGSSFTPNRTYWARTGGNHSITVELVGGPLSHDVTIPWDIARPDRELPDGENALPQVTMVSGLDYLSQSVNPVVIPAGETEVDIEFSFPEKEYWHPQKQMCIRLRSTVEGTSLGRWNCYWLFLLHGDEDTDDWPRFFFCSKEEDPPIPPAIADLEIKEGATSTNIHFPVKLSGPNPEGAVIYCTWEHGTGLLTNSEWDDTAKTITFAAGITEVDMVLSTPTAGIYTLLGTDVSEDRRNLFPSSAIGEERWDKKRCATNGVGHYGIPGEAWPGMWNYGIDNTHTWTGSSLVSNLSGSVVNPDGTPAYSYNNNPNAGNNGGVMCPFEQDNAGYPWDKVTYCNRPPSGEHLIYSCYWHYESARYAKIYILDRTLQVHNDWWPFIDVGMTIDSTTIPVPHNFHNLGGLLDWQIVDVGGGWYRLAISWETPADPDLGGGSWEDHVMQFVVLPTDSLSGDWTNEYGSYLWGMQAEHSEDPALGGLTAYQPIKDAQRRTPGNCILGYPYGITLEVS